MRVFDSTSGRYISADPIGQGLVEVLNDDYPLTSEHLTANLRMNPFAYGGSDPVNLRDPSGLIVAQVIGGVVGATMGAALSYGPNASWQQIGTAAVAGVASTLPIPGVPSMLSGGLMGGLAALGGNAGLQAASGAPCGGIDWKSAATSGLAGMAAGFAGGAVQDATGSAGLGAYVSGLATTYFDFTARSSPQVPATF